MDHHYIFIRIKMKYFFRPALAEKFRAAHIGLTAWINAHSAEAQAVVCAGLTAETKREMSAVLVARAWRRLRFTSEISASQFALLVDDAQTVGFLRNAIPLDRFFSGQP